MLTSRKLPALLGLLLVLALVGGTVAPSEASTGRQRAHAKAAVAKAKKHVAEVRTKVKAAERAYVAALETRQGAVDAATAAATTYGAAEARRQTAAADVPPKQAAYDQANATLNDARNARDGIQREYDGRELARDAAQSALDREKNKWAACTRQSGSFQCKKTNNSAFEDAPAVESAYQDREKAQAKFEQAAVDLANADALVNQVIAETNQAGATLGAAQAELAAATDAAAAALATKTSADSAKTAADARVVATKAALAGAQAKLVKAKNRLAKARARLRNLS